MTFPEAGAAFYQDLAMNNEKSWWQENRGRWERDVRDPMLAITGGLRREFGEAKVFRPHRDTRFSKDKTPYKTHQGAYVETVPATGWYVELSADGLTTGAGFYHAEPKLLAAYRSAVDSESRGHELEVILEELTAAGWELRGARLATAPRGYSVDHPRIALLRHKDLSVRRPIGPEVVGEDAAEARIAEDWRELEPLVAWVSDEFERAILRDDPNAFS